MLVSRTATTAAGLLGPIRFERKKERSGIPLLWRSPKSAGPASTLEIPQATNPGEQVLVDRSGGRQRQKTTVGIGIGPNNRLHHQWEREMSKNLCGIAKLAIAVTALAALASTTASAVTLKEIKQRGYIRIAVANEIPYGYVDPNGDAKGAGPDVAKAVVKMLGIDPKNIQWVVTNFSSLIPGLQANRFDMTAAEMAIRPERCKKVVYSAAQHVLWRRPPGRKRRPEEASFLFRLQEAWHQGRGHGRRGYAGRSTEARCA